MTSRRGRRLIAIALIVAAGLLTGCRLQADVTVQLEPSGAGVLTLALSADPDLQERAAAAGVDPLADVARAAAEAGWTVNHSREGEQQTVSISQAFTDPEELATLSSDLSGVLAGPELAPLAPLEVRLTDRTVELDGEMSLALTDAVGDLGMTEDEAVELLGSAARLRFTARLPGEILEANHDAQNTDGALVWTIPAGESRAIRAVSTRPRPLLLLFVASLTPPVLAATVTGSLSVLFWWWWWSRTRTEDLPWPRPSH